MSRLFYHVMQDNLGNLLFGVSGTMRIAGTGTAATIYGDAALTIPLPNPMTNHASYGSFKCYLGAGSYDFYMAKTGYNFETLTGLAGGGSMANQEANAVAITGGNAVGLTSVGIGTPTPTAALDVAGAVVISASLAVDTTTLVVDSVNNTVGVKRAPRSNISLDISWPKTAGSAGLALQQSANDAAADPAVIFANAAGTTVGSITTTGSATAYNTSSDVRLKKMVEMFEGALDLVHQLRPVRFRWRADESAGQGFLANEVQQVIDGVVTGEPDAMNEDGSIRPQQIDHSKLVPLLTAAVKELSAQVQTLTVRVRELELLSVLLGTRMR